MATTIKTTLGVGSVASPFYIDVNITKQLCTKTANTPVFIPLFTLVSYRMVSSTEAEGQYEAIVNVQGIVTYTPCGACCTKSQAINEQFVIPFYSATTPSAITVTSGSPTNSLITNGCCSKCSNMFMCDVPLSFAFSTT